MKKINVLIADDHRLFSDGLNSVLNGHEAIEICATVFNGLQAVEYIAKEPCDVVILDINMPVMNGIDAAKIIRQNSQHVKILILTTYNDKEFINELLAIGVSGYLMKNASATELIEAIPILQEFLSDKKKKSNAQAESTIHLTEREIEIVKLLAKEYTNEKIAASLHISYRTVETHRKNIMQKTKSQNLAGLIRYAFEKDLLR
jgi:DNA-binding NarL/FixJ family response regulator